MHVIRNLDTLSLAVRKSERYPILSACIVTDEDPRAIQRGSSMIGHSWCSSRKLGTDPEESQNSLRILTDGLRLIMN